VILKLPPSTTIYPGHDYGDVPFRKLGEEAQSNPVLSARTYAEFLSVP
jgi:glyoxylase-like metal-dependent hydrolase (beta-lactamase superfamily II)